jgi:tricorn protease
MKSPHRLFVPVLWLLPLLGSIGHAETPLLLRSPSLSQTQIAFGYAGDIWVVAREGGEAKRLTNGVAKKGGPVFSPDGQLIAYTANYYGNDDVFVIPAAGGEPRQITHHPGADGAVGWGPDGKSVLFVSSRTSATDPPKLFTAPAEGGPATELPLPMASDGVFSPDGRQVAYSPRFQWQAAWKKYRGGQTMFISIANLADSSIEKLPRENSNDFNPMWVGDKIYFLSDRAGAVTLFSYEIKSKKVKEEVKNDGLDLKSAAAGPSGIVYEQFGGLHLFDLKSGKSKPVPVTIHSEFAELLPHYEKLDAGRIQDASLSPTGARAVISVHGEVLTIPAQKGDIRNLTRSPAVADRDPAWSPDGMRIAYFSDESGEYALHIRNQNGLGDTKKIDLGMPPSYFYSPQWSPDGKKVLYSDKRLNLWYLDVEKGGPVKVDTDYYDSPSQDLSPDWSPDSKWIAYTKQLQSHLHGVFVYELASAKATQVTDGLSDALNTQWDKNGKYMYFTASTTVGLAASWLDMSSIDRPITSNAYVAVLRKDDPSPLAPESDEEKKADEKDAKKDGDASKPGEAKPGDSKTGDKDRPKPVDVRIDFDGMSQRILALPVPAANYKGLIAGKEGELFLIDQPIIWRGDGPPPLTANRFTLSKRKSEPYLSGINFLTLSANGEKALYRQGNAWFIAGADAAPKPGDGALKLGEMQVWVEPKAEWKQMYHEVWRIERDFLYDANAHGLNLKQAEKFYEPYIESVESRDDLNYLFVEMLGNLTLGHVFIGGGVQPEVPKVNVGLLGADYSVENGRYRFKKIYNGENWNPELQAPLTQPGVNVQAGEYLLTVNGRYVQGSDDIYAFFTNTAGKQLVLRVGPNPDGTGAREVTVIPVDSEFPLRNYDWIESNRRKVDQMTGGRVAYVHLPDTANGGYTNFNRYFFAQVGKEGVILDERFNHGGDLADYIIDYLRRPVMSLITSREGHDFRSPGGAIYGPKVMIINEFAGSGGDAMPWYFRKAGLGPLIGKNTWGGLVGIYGYPTLIDGGSVTAPRVAIFGLKGEWEVEGHGIAPDIDVEMDPKLVREGHDPQLEKAVGVVMEQLKKNPLPEYKKPSYPDHHPAVNDLK